MRFEMTYQLIGMLEPLYENPMAGRQSQISEIYKDIVIDIPAN
jgi:hypothetical protein